MLEVNIGTVSIYFCVLVIIIHAHHIGISAVLTLMNNSVEMILFVVLLEKLI